MMFVPGGETFWREEGGAEMPTYMVERNLPGITMEQLAGAQREAIETGKRMTAEGKNVR